MSINLPPGVTEEDLRRFLNQWVIDQNAYKLLRKNPEYKALLKAHRKAVAERKATIDEASILWTKILNMRKQARLEAEKNLERKEVPNAPRR